MNKLWLAGAGLLVVGGLLATAPFIRAQLGLETRIQPRWRDGASGWPFCLVGVLLLVLAT